MKIVDEFPPNYKEICKVFDVRDRPTIIFTYGDTIYNPSKIKMPPELLIHEQTHIFQQEKIGAEKWWEQYLTDAKFRLSQELEAYRNQWAYVREKCTTAYGKTVYRQIIRDISGVMYGNMITKKQAEELIKWRGDK